MRVVWSCAAAGWLVSATACASASLREPPPDLLGNGVIDVGAGTDGRLEVPDTVSAGVPFIARVSTLGSSTCTFAAPTEVRIRGRYVDLAVLDRSAPPETVCTDDISPIPREVELSLTTRGRMLIRVHGRNLRGERAVTSAEVVVR